MIMKALGYCFNLPELFENFDLNRLEMKCKDYRKIACDFHREDLVQKIFKESVKMVINDVIENNVTFQLPTGAKKADIHMQKFQDEEFIKARSNGKFPHVDFLSSFFTGYELGFYIYGDGNVRVKPIHVNKELRNKLIEYTNKGKQYC